MQCSNYVYNLPDDDLLKSKHVVEETTMIHDSIAHHQYTENDKKLNLQDCPSQLKDP
jgi:hypothetical protein